MKKELELDEQIQFEWFIPRMRSKCKNWMMRDEVSMKDHLWAMSKACELLVFFSNGEYVEQLTTLRNDIDNTKELPIDDGTYLKMIRYREKLEKYSTLIFPKHQSKIFNEALNGR